jgi:hypothetical protein
MRQLCQLLRRLVKPDSPQEFTCKSFDYVASCLCFASLSINYCNELLIWICSVCNMFISHSHVWVPRDPLPYLRLSQPGQPGPRVYIPQEQGGPVIPSGTGFPFRRLLRLAGLRWRYSTPPPRGEWRFLSFRVHMKPRRGPYRKRGLREFLYCYVRVFVLLCRPFPGNGPVSFGFIILVLRGHILVL